MNRTRMILLLPVVALAAYLLLAPTPLNPVAWAPPEAPEWTGPWQTNRALDTCELIDLPGDDYGPESIAVDGGSLLISSHSGKLWRYRNGQFSLWRKRSGQPLGIEVADDQLWVADAKDGLLALALKGHQGRRVSVQFEGQAHGFVDDLAVAKDGRVYFSDATTKIWPEHLRKDPTALSAFDILEGRGHGRLYVYDPATRSTELLRDRLLFANGVAMGGNDDFVLINETGRYQVWRHWLKGPKAGSEEIFIGNLPGFPDNITEAPDGGFWLALIKPRSTLTDLLAPWPAVRKMVSRLPPALLPTGARYGHVVKLSAEGEVEASYQDPSGRLANITSALEHRGKLYLGNLTEPHFAICDIDQL
ncbi:MAG: SMP-30/gluconolactonase/LRE family protein [Pseudomonadota bacterium]